MDHDVALLLIGAGIGVACIAIGAVVWRFLSLRVERKKMQERLLEDEADLALGLKALEAMKRQRVEEAQQQEERDPEEA